MVDARSYNIYTLPGGRVGAKLVDSKVAPSPAEILAIGQWDSKVPEASSAEDNSAAFEGAFGSDVPADVAEALQQTQKKRQRPELKASVCPSSILI